MSEPSRRQVDELGERIRKSLERFSSEDLEMLAAYQRSLREPLTQALDEMRARWTERLDLPWAPTVREKQLRSIASKLERLPSTRLTQIQDIVGFRVVVPSISEQGRFLEGDLGDAWRIRDHRDSFESGYRAVHLVRRENWRSVEVQLRTELQHLWAEVSEWLDRRHPGIKFGSGPTEVMEGLAEMSEIVREIEEAELSPKWEQSRDVAVEARKRAVAQIRGILESIKEVP